VVKTKILIATTNPGKMKELSAMLDADAEWLSLADFPNINEVEEDGKTFAENARKKALGYAKQTGLWTIADDSGLMVDALNGAPGVNSARFSGSTAITAGGEKEKHRTLLDHKNMAKLLGLLENVPDGKRTARFVCSICLATPEKVLIETQGQLEGVIGRVQKGSNGFGYDPLFVVPASSKTVAQLSEEEKNQISHRANAIKNFNGLFTKFLP
jgi:non-canonical purine NTP pyrophosphatase (RdgB/HAM1 family)